LVSNKNPRPTAGFFMPERKKQNTYLTICLFVLFFMLIKKGLTMDTRQVRLKLRDAVNKFTGKQNLIDQYDDLNMELCNISDRTPNGTPLKRYLRENLDRITEAQTYYTMRGVFCIDTYDPYQGSKAETRKKIADFQSVLQKVREMQSQQPHQK